MAMRGAVKSDTFAYELVVVLIAIGLLYNIFALPYITSILSNSSNPIANYLMWNVGYYLMISGIFGTIFGIAIGRVDGFSTFKYGLAGFVLFSWLFDMFQPPIAWAMNGTLNPGVTATGQELVAVDYVWGWAFQQIGVGGWPMFYLVYIAVPIFAVIMAFLLLVPDWFVRQSGLGRYTK